MLTAFSTVKARWAHSAGNSAIEIYVFIIIIITKRPVTVL